MYLLQIKPFSTSGKSFVFVSLSMVYMLFMKLIMTNLWMDVSTHVHPCCGSGRFYVSHFSIELECVFLCKSETTTLVRDRWRIQYCHTRAKTGWEGKRKALRSMSLPRDIYTACFLEMPPHRWERKLEHLHLLCRVSLQLHPKVLFLGLLSYDLRTFHRRQAQHYKHQSSA